MTNCPNCGAPIISFQCEYCGTRFAEKDVSSHPYDTMLQSGILTANEIRTLLGLKPVKLAPVWCSPVSLADAYSQGEIVTHDGVLYQSLIHRNVYHPSHSNVWQILEQF